LQDIGIRVRAAARHPTEGPWSEFIPLDLPDSIPAGLSTGVRIVYHLAGLAHAMGVEGDARLYDAVNGRGTGEVARRAKSAGVQRFVFMSSAKAVENLEKASSASTRRARRPTRMARASTTARSPS